MKKLVLTLTAILFGGIFAFADEPLIRDIQIRCRLDSLGFAYIEEMWNVRAVSGTEWYLVRENLGDIEIKDLCVSEDGVEFINEGRWDIDRNIDAKAGKCGIHGTSRGCEICWGIGNYGDHIFNVSYTITNVVKSLDDYDMLHLQFISDELSSAPEHAKVVISLPDTQLDTTNTRIWAYGYYGDINFIDGEIVAESSESFSYNSSMIVLARFDKGVIKSPQSFRDGPFEDHLKKAQEGSDYSSGELGFFGKLFSGIFMFFVILVQGGWVVLIPPILIINKYVMRKRFLGTTKKSEVTWSREIPFFGDLSTTNYVLSQINEGGKSNSIASAMILQMIRKGAILVKKSAIGDKETVELALNKSIDIEQFDSSTRRLWDMMLKASGEDEVLQENEFSRWANSNKSVVAKWADDVEALGKSTFESSIWCTKRSVNNKGREECRKALGLKKFLKDFTLLKERTAQEAVLWDDYIVFAALFGVAEKVAKELKEINPALYEQLEATDPITLHNVMYMSDNLSRAITRTTADYKASQARSSGGGGHSSFGGGGGFSGGGHGGGSR